MKKRKENYNNKKANVIKVRKVQWQPTPRAEAWTAKAPTVRLAILVIHVSKETQPIKSILRLRDAIQHIMRCPHGC